MPTPEHDERKEASVGIVAYGTSHWAVTESRDQLLAEEGLETSYYRIRGYPFRTSPLARFIERHERVYVVEQNRDAQMLSLMKLELAPELTLRLRSVRHYSGLPIDARSITDSVLLQEGLRIERATPRQRLPHKAGVGGE